MTLRNFDAILNDSLEEPNEFNDGVDDNGKPKPPRVMTQCEMVLISLGNGPIGEDGRPKNIQHEDKRRMYDLSKKMRKGGDIDIDSRETTLISRCIAHLSPILWGQIDDSLNRDLPPTAPPA